MAQHSNTGGLHNCVHQVIYSEMDHAEEGPIPSAIGPYELSGVISEGPCSIVKVALHSTENMHYACKIVPRASLRDPLWAKQFESEIRISQQLRHPGIVQIVDLLKDEHNCYVLMELCSNGDLLHHINHKGHLSEEEAANFLNQILEAVAYCHSKGIAHRDLKPENFLLDPVMSVKMCDFGLSRLVGENGMMNTPCGSPFFASPECLSMAPYDGCASDMWSIGVTLYAMVTGRVPWTKRNRNDLFKQIRAGDFQVPDEVSDQCADMILSLMTLDPKERLTAQDALAHPFMQQADQLSYSQQDLHTVSLETVDSFFADIMPVQESKTPAERE